MCPSCLKVIQVKWITGVWLITCLGINICCGWVSVSQHPLFGVARCPWQGSPGEDGGFWGRTKHDGWGGEGTVPCLAPCPGVSGWEQVECNLSCGVASSTSYLTFTRVQGKSGMYLQLLCLKKHLSSNNAVLVKRLPSRESYLQGVSSSLAETWRTVIFFFQCSP